MGLKAIVRNGRLLMDLPVDLPDGTEFQFVLDDVEGPAPGSAEHQELNAALERAAASLAAGEGVDGDELIARLRAKRA